MRLLLFFPQVEIIMIAGRDRSDVLLGKEKERMHEDSL